MQTTINRPSKGKVAKKLRVFLLIFEGSVFSPDITEHLVLNTSHDVIGVGAVIPRKKGSENQWLKSQIEFWGWRGMFSLAAITMFRRMARVFRLSKALSNRSSVRSVCGALEIPYQVVRSVNDPEFVEQMRGSKVDVIISFQQQIFKDAILATPKVACLNVHTSNLPLYRGVRPVFWAMLDGVEKFGVSVHTMTADIDAGKIVHQKFFERRPRASLLENYFWSYEVAGSTIVEGLDRLEDVIWDQLQDIELESPYFKAPSVEDRRRFLGNGLKLA